MTSFHWNHLRDKFTELMNTKHTKSSPFPFQLNICRLYRPSLILRKPLPSPPRAPPHLPPPRAPSPPTPARPLTRSLPSTTTQKAGLYLWMRIYQKHWLMYFEVTVDWLPLHTWLTRKSSRHHKLVLYRQPPWWRHQMDRFSVLLAICAGKSQKL